MTTLPVRRQFGRGRVWLGLAAVAAGLAALFLLLATTSFVQSAGYAFDFNCYFGGAQRLVNGAGLYLPQNVDAPFQHGAPGVYVYAPPLAVLLMPVALLPFGVAAFGWLILHLAALAAACALMPVSRGIRLTSFAVAAASSPFLVDMNLGNVSTFVLLLTVIEWRWLDRPLGSVATAMAIAIRPQMAIVLGWWAIRRRLSALAWCIAAGLATIALTLPVVGLSGYVDFLRVVRNDQVAGVVHNGSLESVALLLGMPAPFPTLAFVAGAILAVGAIAVSLRRDRELSYVVTVSAALLVTPLLWGHYLVLLLVPAAFLAQRGRVWALALPLLGWLPDGAIAIAAFCGLLLPLLAPGPEGVRGALDDRLAEQEPVPGLRAAPVQRSGG